MDPFASSINMRVATTQHISALASEYFQNYIPEQLSSNPSPSDPQ
jgi:hypothetical protein